MIAPQRKMYIISHGHALPGGSRDSCLSLTSTPTAPLTLPVSNLSSTSGACARTSLSLSPSLSHNASLSLLPPPSQFSALSLSLSLSLPPFRHLSLRPDRGPDCKRQADHASSPNPDISTPPRPSAKWGTPSTPPRGDCVCTCVALVVREGGGGAHPWRRTSIPARRGHCGSRGHRRRGRGAITALETGPACDGRKVEPPRSWARPRRRSKALGV